MTPTTISPLQAFQEAFPSIKLIASEDELHYTFKSETCFNLYWKMAQKLILKEGLPLTAEKEIWEKKGFVFELALVVRMVPEEYAIG